MAYTMKQAAEKMNMSVHTLRFYANEGLFPTLERDGNNVRHFTENDLEWITLVQCLRDTGMGLVDIRHYIELCRMGDESIPERYQIILHQREVARHEMEEMRQRMDHLEHKVAYYQDLLVKSGIPLPITQMEDIQV
jgi:MerR family transcriptional regulator, aldehyde-responsive regulator